jgi:mutator protein MutT
MKSEFKFCPLCSGVLINKIIDLKKRLYCKSCGWINYINPLPVTIAIVTDRDNNVLVIKRNLEPGLGKWAFPGGFIEAGERAEDSCLRELKEETGIEGEIEELLGAAIEKTAEYGDLIVLGYKVRALNKDIQISDEVKESKFVNWEELPAITFPTHREMVRILLERSR